MTTHKSDEQQPDMQQTAEMLSGIAASQPMQRMMDAASALAGFPSGSVIQADFGLIPGPDDTPAMMLVIRGPVTDVRVVLSKPEDWKPSTGETRPAGTTLS